MSALQTALLTRRRLLGALGSALVLAGCADETSVEDEETVSDRPVAEPPPEATTDFEIRSVRAPVDEPFVDLDDGEDRPEFRLSPLFVLEEEAAESLAFEAAIDGVEDARSFVSETDFGTESVVIFQREIEECYRRHTQYVEIEPNRFRVQFCRELRDATTPCEAGVREMEAIFLRIPYAYEERPSRRGSGERGRCRSDVRVDDAEGGEP